MVNFSIYFVVQNLEGHSPSFFSWLSHGENPPEKTNYYQQDGENLAKKISVTKSLHFQSFYF
jgi:hypothetical protein